MKKGHVLHNPKAGSAAISKKELLALIREKGIECGYSSTKKAGWKEIHPDADFIIIAGGDGTVRKVAVELLDREKSAKKLPVLLLPLGTANNISKTLGLTGDLVDIIAHVHSGNRKRYDAGRIKGLGKDALFLESFGYGIFPELISRMEQVDPGKEAAPEESIKTALEVLYKITRDFPALPATVKVDDETYSGNYLMIEVMNISFFGPNLQLSPASDPGDGVFEVVLIPESQREEFAAYIWHKMNGIEKGFTPLLAKGKKVVFEIKKGLLHTDDKLAKVQKPVKIMIRPEKEMMEFFVG
ncbi:MAG TPA: diacylglycerol kinase family protein [Chitinophagaceae bacterium]|nr:diacylglycerol kinase family protein [Chitinophagaceae bacterium]